MKIINKNIFGVKSIDTVVAGKTIEKDSKVWLGFLINGKDYDSEQHRGADFIIEFENKEQVKTVIELLEDEIKGDDNDE